MRKQGTHIVVFITARDMKQAQLISQTLIREKLAACSNMISGVTSFFSWEGKLDRAKEVLVILKTTQKVFSNIVTRVQQLHSYHVPEIIALPIIDGNQEYLRWISQTVKGKKE
jgi:periplasmic divalent cation tolerance protein